MKSDLERVIDEEGSLMPAYDREHLSDGALDDLMAYLGTLRPGR